MKILFISPHPGFGGASTANRTMAEMMTYKGYEVVYMDEYAEGDMGEYKFIYSDFPIHKNATRERAKTAKYIETNSFDIIFIGVPIIGFYYWYLLRKLKNKGVKICYVFHSLSLSNGLFGKVDELLQSLALYNATDLLFVSQFTLDSWSKYAVVRKMKVRSHVIYNAIKEQDITNRIIGDKYKVSFVGRLSEEKDPTLFCKVAKESFVRSLPFSFHMYGDGPLMELLKKEFTGCVTFHGFERDGKKIYSNTDILLMTSHFENCPMAILESSAHGIPCVAPKVGGITEIVKSGFNGLLFTSRDSEDILKCLNEIQMSYPSFSENAYSESKKYKYDVISTEWEKKLQKIING